MMNTVELFGKQVKIAFNLAAQIAYEDITGNAFELHNITTVKARTALYMACIIAGDSHTQLDMDKLLTDLMPDELKAIDDAVAKMIREWYNLPDPAQKEEHSKKKKHSNRS